MTYDVAQLRELEKRLVEAKGPDDPPFYDDEAVLLSWGESPKDGAWIKLQITEDTVPFLRGLKRGAEHGERFAMVLTGPLQNDETAIPSPQDKRGISAGGGVGRDGETRGSPATPTNSIAPVVGVDTGGGSASPLSVLLRKGSR